MTARERLRGAVEMTVEKWVQHFYMGYGQCGFCYYYLDEVESHRHGRHPCHACPVAKVEGFIPLNIYDDEGCTKIYTHQFTTDVDTSERRAYCLAVMVYCWGFLND